MSLTFELCSFDQYPHIVLHSFEQKFKKFYQVWFVKWKYNITHTHTHKHKQCSFLQIQHKKTYVFTPSL
jgi:exopolysaccharide biosynthesis predicted pyruvyltransferase EpsI